MTSGPEAAPNLRIVVGLGNPGDRYRGTRHNVGFDIVDRVATELGWIFTSKAPSAAAAEGEVAGRPGRLVKPLDFMNRSGPALRQVFGEDPVHPSSLLVVLDDLALGLGSVRLRARGSSGGHRGLESILETFGTDEIARFRIGIGGQPAAEWRDFVLAPFLDSERERIDEALHIGARVSRGWLAGESAADLARQWNRVFPPA